MNWQYEKNRIYALDDKKELLAEITFVSKSENEVVIDHTYVNPSLRGQGVAGKMMEVMMSYIQENNLKTTATCSYADSWLEKNKERFQELIANKDVEQTVACKLNAKY